MPRRFFRRVSSGYLRKEQPWYLRPFDMLSAHPTFLSVNRRSVAGAIWIGLFIGLLPLPGQTIIAILAALMLRVNMPIAAVTPLITNPLTMGPIFYWEYGLGRLILDIPPRNFAIELSWDWVTTGFIAIWKPLLLGCFITATIVASIGYLAVSVTWRLIVAARYRRRHISNR
ncbi:MAG: hypothetical protein CL797_05445 [Chromatiales bacterium]|nr:hypothetical protein [Chromatiales bacterium]